MSDSQSGPSDGMINNPRTPEPDQESQQKPREKLVESLHQGHASKCNDACKKYSNKSKDAFWWIWRRTPDANQSLAIGTWVLAIIALYALWDSREALEQNQRAWIAPLKFSFVNLNDATDPLKVRILYQNIGRESAKTLKNVRKIGYIRTPNPASPAKWDELPVWESEKSFRRDEICKGITEIHKTSVVYPSPTFAFAIDIGMSEDATFPNSLIPVLFNEVKEQHTVLFVTGCFSYKTMNRTRYSTFCVYLNPAAGGKDINEWGFSVCPIGNDDY
ncbi:MAG: hypothetical protein WAM29_14610 [Methylocella sp.]